MTNLSCTCHIWNTPVSPVPRSHTGRKPTWIKDSPRASGGYETDGFVDERTMSDLTDSQKALLTSWLIDQRKQGIQSPRITAFGIHPLIENLKPLQIGERADRLLTFFAERSQAIGQQIEIALPDFESVDPSRYNTFDDVPESIRNLWRAMAWSESTTIREVVFLVDYLAERRRLKRLSGPRHEWVSVTVDGYAHIEDSRVNADLGQAFVAMWFDDETNDAFDQGFQPAVEGAGYTTMRIDRKEHINKIDDEIIAEIRRSRFLVADFSQGDDGARGGVYFEAGFALGLGIPVISTCRKSDIDKLHFDTRQYNHIVWETPEELRDALKNRILAVIGEGPNTP